MVVQRFTSSKHTSRKREATAESKHPLRTESIYLCRLAGTVRVPPLEGSNISTTVINWNWAFALAVHETNLAEQAGASGDQLLDEQEKLLFTTIIILLHLSLLSSADSDKHVASPPTAEPSVNFHVS